MSKQIGTVHVTNGKTSMVINKSDLGSERYKDFKPVEKVKSKPAKKKAKAEKAK